MEEEENVEGEEKGEANLVLVIKGDVIRRYPDIIVYAIKCNAVVTTVESYNNSSKVLIEPLFRAQLGEDIGIWGFPLSLEDLTEASNSETHFFVLQEQQDLPVFGFDLSDSIDRRNPGNRSWEGEGEILEILSANQNTNQYIEDFAATIDNNSYY